jgi:hypothetical protein
MGFEKKLHSLIIFYLVKFEFLAVYAIYRLIGVKMILFLMGEGMHVISFIRKCSVYKVHYITILC